MGRMAEPDFTVRHRRVPEIPETGAHVSPEMLAMISPKSRYVRRWKRHARRCLPCANVFRYYGIASIDRHSDQHPMLGKVAEKIEGEVSPAADE